MNYVKGTVYDRTTDEPIIGATVYLHEHQNMKSFAVIDSVLTNNKGEYHINFSKIINRTYYVSCRHHDYFDEPMTPDEIPQGRSAVNLAMNPYAYLRLRFIKNSSSDNIAEGWVDQHTDLRSFLSPRPKGTYPNYVFTPYDSTYAGLIRIIGNENHILQWKIMPMYGPGTDSISRFTFYIAKNDTLNYTITFN